MILALLSSDGDLSFFPNFKSGFPGDSAVKNLPIKQETWFHPRVGNSSEEENGNPF